MIGWHSSATCSGNSIWRGDEVGGGTGSFFLFLNTAEDATVWYEVVSTTGAEAPVPGRSYYLVAKHSGRCLDVQGGPAATENGALLQQWSCWGGDNQKWQLTASSQGAYEIASKSSGKALDVTGEIPR